MDNNLVCELISFNCKNVKRSAGDIRSLCSTASIIALQETWLLPQDIPFLGTIHNDFEYFGKSSMDVSQNLLRGRLYGGVGLLWRKNQFQSVSVIACDNVRIAAVRFELSDRSFIVMSVYMPWQCADHFPEFTDCLSEISAIIESAQVESVYVLGDFNAHPTEMFANELMSFCAEQQWFCADMEKLGISSGAYTFVSDAHGSRRWLDHCIVTRAAWDSVKDIKVLCHNVLWSDHYPVVMYCDLNIIRPRSNVCYPKCDKVIWGERNNVQTKEYFELCNLRLRELDFPSEFCVCGDRMCSDVTHRNVLDSMYSNIVNTLRDAAEITYKAAERKPKGKSYILGWNKHVSAAHRDARHKLNLWFWHGKPGNGVVYNSMRESRKLFKNKLKWCQKHRDQIKMDIIAEHRASKNFSKFWKSTNKLNLKPSLPVSVEGLSDSKDIANIFKNSFKVDSPLGKSMPQVFDTKSVADTACKVSFSAEQVRKVLQKITSGKSPGHDGLSVEHLRCAGVHLPRVLSLFYSLCISHSYLPSDLMKTIVVPIIKNRTGDIADKSNYRPISLATIVAKVLDRLLDSQLDKHVKLHDGQFGFRAGLSTESAILSLKHTVRYYVKRNTPVYACFLDLSKAFDTVSYGVLWSKLRSTSLPEETCSVFEYWYNNQINCVKWAGEFSDAYRLECGVRQGGVSSPRLFNLYVNELIEGLSSMETGCSIDGIYVNNLSYADDMVLLAPSVSSLRKLLKFCETYAISHGLRYNVKKSEYMVFSRNGKRPGYVPPLLLNGFPLSRVTQFRYLGHIVCEDLCDEADMDRERRALTVRANMLSRRFSSCSNEAKITLFKAYCQSFYGGSLWTAYTRKSFDALRVQYNNAFRVLMRLPRFCSASSMFAEARTDGFAAIMRKKVASLLCRTRASGNSILRAITDKFDCPILLHHIRVLIK